MSVKLIAENILQASDFLSATEQEGEYIGQPAPDSANTGDFRLLSKGDIEDFTYSGTATSDGTTTTIIDSVLKAFGDDYFISGTITFLTGENTSGTKTIVDFAQATGTITWLGAINSTLTGDTFTLTVSFASRDFKVELIDSGDAGNATFKWSHDGTTYLGRDDPNQANWLAEAVLDTDSDADLLNTVIAIRQTADGNWLAVYNKGSVLQIYRRISTDRGITWGSESQVVASDELIGSLLVMASGRVWLHFAEDVVAYYSDDHGYTWTAATMSPGTGFEHVIELSNGNLLGVFDTFDATNMVYCRISTDGGFNWSPKIEVSALGPTHQRSPTVVQAINGDVFCAYRTDEDGGANDDIKGKISEDNGVTWGSAIDVIDWVSVDLVSPKLEKDINGDIYCVATETLADHLLIFARSTDNAATWGAKTTLKSSAGIDLSGPYLSLVDGHELICAYNYTTTSEYHIVRRGMWEAYSANACPCAIEAQEQNLICDVGVPWHGGGGIAGDKWTFGPEYRYAMSNIICDSPSKPWRSEQDNIACNIVIDLGANERYWADGIGLFGCNIRTCSFQMNAADSWGSPSVDESISFDLATGTVDDVDGNYVQDTSLLANYKDHELKAAGLYFRMTSGTDDTLTWLIKDNVGDYIVLDTTAATNIAATDTFAIFQGNISDTFTGGLYRYLRIAIAAQHTADDYYQIGSIVTGKTITLSKSFSIGYGKDHRYDIDMIRNPHGGMTPIKGADRKRVFNLNFPVVDDTKDEIAALLDYVEGKNITLIPDHSDLKDCYLVKHMGNLQQTHQFKTYFHEGPIIFEEVL